MGSLRLALGKLNDVEKSRLPCGARWDSRKVGRCSFTPA
jgi:hypothetical protein